MSERKDIKVDVERVHRLSGKVFRFILRKAHNPFEAYCVFRELCMFFEHEFDVGLDSASERKIHDIVVEMILESTAHEGS